MAHAYTPGLTIAPSTIVRKYRALPLEGKVMVSEGQAVEAGTVVARAELPGDVHPVNVVGHLGVRPQEIRDYMFKSEGQKVEEGEPLAETRPWIKLFKTVCRAPVGGTVENISQVTGQVLIREPARRIELPAYIRGQVIEVLPGEGAVIETHAALVQGIFGIGGECVGKLTVLVDDPFDQVDPGALDQTCRGCVVLCGAAASLSLLEAARRVGVKALIAGGMPASELQEILGYEIGGAVTGSEQIGLTVVVTEGFGRIPMAQNTFELLRSLEGYRASVSGATQVRAGVLRPEIVIPLDSQAAAKPQEQAPLHTDGLCEGNRVRIIREPYFGRIGVVKELVPELRKIETEAEVRVLRLETPDGQTLTVPRANVEVITG